MTEDIGSDRHPKKTPSQEVEVAVMREQLKQHERRDREDAAFRTVLMQKLDQVILDGHESRKQLALGEQRFKSLEEKQADTTAALTRVVDRVDVVEKSQASVMHKIIGGSAVVGALAGAAAWAKDLFKGASLIAICLLASGCVGKDARTQGKTTTRETIVETPLANGGKITERTVETTDSSETTTATKLDGVGALAAKLGGVAIGAATGTGGAVPWELIIGGATTLLAGGAAAYKTAQAGQLRQDRDFHKLDAEDAYKQLRGKSSA